MLSRMAQCSCCLFRFSSSAASCCITACCSARLACDLADNAWPSARRGSSMPLAAANQPYRLPLAPCKTLVPLLCLDGQTPFKSISFRSRLGWCRQRRVLGCPSLCVCSCAVHVSLCPRLPLPVFGRVIDPYSTHVEKERYVYIYIYLYIYRERDRVCRWII